MTSKEARNIKTQLWVSYQLIEDLQDDYPESININLATEKIRDINILVSNFFEGMIFDDQKVRIEP